MHKATCNSEVPCAKSITLQYGWTQLSRLMVRSLHSFHWYGSMAVFLSLGAESVVFYSTCRRCSSTALSSISTRAIFSRRFLEESML